MAGLMINFILIGMALCIARHIIDTIVMPTLLDDPMEYEEIFGWYPGRGPLSDEELENPEHHA